MKKLIKPVLAVLVGVAINYVGRLLVANLELPLFLDCLGTMAMAYYFGSVVGVLTGLATNVILICISPAAVFYMPISIIIGFFMGRKTSNVRGFMDYFFPTTVAIAQCTAVATIVSYIINEILYGGSTGNVWGDTVTEFLVVRGFPEFIGELIGEFYLDFTDKGFAILLLFAVNRLMVEENIIKKTDNEKYAFMAEELKKKKMKKDKEKEQKKQKAARAGAFLLAAFLMISAVTAVLPKPVYAEDMSQSYIRIVYNNDNGLPIGTANTITTTADGMIWVGTYAGLYSYDGSRFDLITNIDSVKNTNCLYVDSEDRMWIGTNGNGFTVYDNGDIIGSMETEDGLSSDYVRNFIEDGKGNFYIGGSRELDVVNLEKGLKIEKTFPEITDARKLDSDGDGLVACLTSDGVIRLIDDCEIIAEDSSNTYSCVKFLDDGKRLFAGTRTGEVVVFDVSKKTFTYQYTIKTNCALDINFIYRTDAGVTYFCAGDGIGYLDEDGKYQDLSVGTFTDWVEEMTEDYQGNLWFCSSRLGVMKLTKSPFIDHFNLGGIEETVVNAVTSWGGYMYVGTDVGVKILDKRNFRLKENNITRRLDGVRIRCLFPDSKGNLWITTNSIGIICVTPTYHYTYYNSENGLFSDRARAVIELADGTIAISGDAGVVFIKDGEVTDRLEYGDKIGNETVLCMLELDDGSLLLGTDGDGVYIMKDKTTPERNITKQDGLTSGVILRAVNDSMGDGIFLCTGGGLCYIDADGSVRELKNFPYYNNYDLWQIDDENIFVLSSGGVYIVNREDLLNEKENLNYTLLEKNNGLPGVATSNAWNYLAEDGRLYFSGSNGVYSFNTEDYVVKVTEYRIKIPYIKIDGEKIYVKDDDNIVIPKGAGRLEIEPSVLNYTESDPKVSFMMKGVDKTPDVMYLSDLSSITYVNIPCGTYKFNINVIDDKTGEVISEGIYTFVKEKEKYETVSFMLYFYGVMLLILVWLFDAILRSRTLKMVKEQQEEMHKAEEKIEMANQTIMAIARTVDAKDENTSQHSTRVSEYSVLIGREYGLDPDECENLRRAALLHDIGKIGIDDAILKKPAKLSDQEYAVMKSHVVKGGEILKDFTLLENVADGARYHHERYDGNGYAEGLKGEDIPLYARIIGMADAFDAMTANRCYRKKLGLDYVINEIKRCRGTQFDPKMADIMLKLIDEGQIDLETIYGKIEQGRAESAESAESTQSDVTQ